MPRKPSSDATALPAVITGTALWSVALLALSITGSINPPQDGVWWWGVSVVGVLSGLIGIPFLVRRRSRLRARLQ